MAQTQESEGRAPALSAVVGANVYRLRVLRVPRLSQEDLAERAGIAVESLRRLERSRDPAREQLNPRLDTLESLAEALGVRPGELLRWDATTRVYLQGEPAWSPRVLLGHGRRHHTQLPLLVPLT